MFAESATRFVLEIEPQNMDAVSKALRGTRFGVIGTITERPNLKVRSVKAGWLMDEGIDGLKKSWLGTLDW